MPNFDYSLDKASYTWKNALLWGNFINHCKEARKGQLGHRMVHVIIAAALILPIFSQIGSSFEKLIVTGCSDPQPTPDLKLNLAVGRVKINDEERKNARVWEPWGAESKKNDPIIPLKPPIAKTYQQVIQDTSQFTGYKISLPESHPAHGTILTGVSLRPSNLFFAELFKGSTIATTLPGSGKLFAFNTAQEDVRKYIQQKAKQNPDEVVAFSAQGQKGEVINGKGERIQVDDLGEIFGNRIFQMSYREILATLLSQKIYTAVGLPKQFYSGLKKAMKADNTVILPGHDGAPVLLRDMKGKNIEAFIEEVKQDEKKFGFFDPADFTRLLDLTIYQIGSLVVKSEDFRIFVDGDGKMTAREPGKNDAIRLINACGIRGIYANLHPTQPKINREIMTEAFKAAFKAAEKGVLIFPAVGMGIWSGDPDIYWRAFLDALLVSDDQFDLICVNPGHQPTKAGKYKNSNGEEFQKILQEYKNIYELAGNTLNKIKNLYDSKTDVVQLAHNLKKAFPEKTVSLFNGSDPDVTLGYHVGEYVNNMPHASTTEENYTAMGTNGLCFEGLTGVHENPERIF